MTEGGVLDVLKTYFTTRLSYTCCVSSDSVVLMNEIVKNPEQEVYLLIPNEAYIHPVSL